MRALVKKTVVCSVVLVICLMSVSGALAHRPHVGVDVWLGPGWWAPYPYPYYAYPSPYYYREPPIIVQQPEVYVQPAPAPVQQPAYWYFCKDPQGYYPYVKQCPSGWMKVVPTPPDQPVK